MRKHDRIKEEVVEYTKIMLCWIKALRSSVEKFKQEIKNPLYVSMSGVQRKCFAVCSVFVSIYITWALYVAGNGLLFTGLEGTITVLICAVVLSIIARHVIVFLCFRFRESGIVIHKKNLPRKETFFLSSALCFTSLLVALAIWFPGGENSDIQNQWSQVQTFVFNDWHPVIHTFLIWLITRIVNHYAFVILVQMSIFSLGVGYLLVTLESWGFNRKWLLVSWLVITFNPYTWKFMTYAFKDVAFAIILLYIAVMTFNIYFSEGKWFSKIHNNILFGVLLGLAFMIRHNGMFFTLPLLVLVAALYLKQNRRVLIAVLSFCVFIFLVKGPLYSFLDVEYPENTYIESVGIPMTIMGDVLVKNPAKLTPETKVFLNTIASDDEWHSIYSPGSYNSIKFIKNASDVVKSIPVDEFFGMTVRTIRNAPYEAFHAFCTVTENVWNLELSLGGLLKKTGWFMMLLLLAGIFSLSKNGSCALLFVVPPVLYNLGTMLLLCDNQTRFFQYNVVITIPIVLVLLAKKSLYRQTPFK